MAEVKITIGGREFEVACRDGEEHFLQSAAVLLDNEASVLHDALGRMPETRMLLMSGLMLADKTASLEDQLKAAGTVAASAEETVALQNRLQKAETTLSETQSQLADAKAALAEAQAKMEGEVEKIKTTLNEALSKAESEAEKAKAALAEMQAKLTDEVEKTKGSMSETLAAAEAETEKAKADLAAMQAKEGSAENAAKAVREERDKVLVAMEAMVKKMEATAEDLQKAE